MLSLFSSSISLLVDICLMKPSVHTFILWISDGNILQPVGDPDFTSLGYRGDMHIARPSDMKFRYQKVILVGHNSQCNFP